MSQKRSSVRLLVAIGVLLLIGAGATIVVGAIVRRDSEAVSPLSRSPGASERGSPVSTGVRTVVEIDRYDLVISVLGESGEPIAGASVAWLKSNGSSPDRRTDEFGVVTVTRDSDGPAELIRASCPGYEDGEARVERASRAVSVVLSKLKAEIRGSVAGWGKSGAECRDVVVVAWPSGSPLPDFGADFGVAEHNARQSEMRVVGIDLGGAFVLDHLRIGGSYDILAAAPGKMAESPAFNVSVGSEHVELKLVSVIAVAFSVRDQTGSVPIVDPMFLDAGGVSLRLPAGCRILPAVLGSELLAGVRPEFVGIPEQFDKTVLLTTRDPDSVHTARVTVQLPGFARSSTELQATPLSALDSRSVIVVHDLAPCRGDLSVRVEQLSGTIDWSHSGQAQAFELILDSRVKGAIRMNISPEQLGGAVLRGLPCGEYSPQLNSVSSFFTWPNADEPPSTGLRLGGAGGELAITLVSAGGINLLISPGRGTRCGAPILARVRPYSESRKDSVPIGHVMFRREPYLMGPLAPGLYEVSLAGAADPEAWTTVDVSAGAVSSVTLNH